MGNDREGRRRSRHAVETIAQYGVDRNVEQRSGLLLAQPDRRARILRPGHPKDVRRPLRSELQQQKPRHHMRLASSCVDPPGYFAIAPYSIPRLICFEAQPRRFIGRDDSVILGKLVKVL